MKLLFFGTPELAVPFLKTLYEDPSIEIVGVVCQPDKPVGRKQTVLAPAVKQFALQKNLPVFQFESLKKPEAIEILKTVNADVCALVVYGKFLPDELLHLTPLGVVNMHPSLLPSYRGPSPIKSAILHGESVTGISVMLLDQGMDTGPILDQLTIALDPRETNTSLEQKICEKGPSFFLQTIKSYGEKQIFPKHQDHTKATITKLLDKEDGKIDWNQSAIQIDRQIRAFDPWPGTWTNWGTNRLKIIQAIPASLSLESSTIGTVYSLDEQLFVQTGDGVLQLLKVQLEGKQPQDAQIFLRGYQAIIGSQLT